MGTLHTLPKRSHHAKPKAVVETEHGVSKSPLGASAMLVWSKVSKWANRTVERDLADKTADDQQAEHGMFFTTKKLVPREAITSVTRAITKFKTFHYDNTLPWLDNGIRILPSAHFEKYNIEARKLIDDAMIEVDQFLKLYPKIRENSRKALGKAFDENDYPQPAVLRTRWEVRIRIMPLPDRADFRADIPAGEIETIRKNIDAQIQEGVKNATHDMFQRLHKVVSNMRDRVNEYGKQTPVKGKEAIRTRQLRDSAITNIRELCELLPSLNFTNDPTLTALAKEINDSLGKQNPDTLRENEDLRKSAVKKADDILERMKSYMG